MSCRVTRAQCLTVNEGYMGAAAPCTLAGRLLLMSCKAARAQCLAVNDHCYLYSGSRAYDVM